MHVMASDSTRTMSRDGEGVAGNPGVLTPFVPKQSVQLLFVDDDRALREECEGLLRAQGYHPTVTGRGVGALELVRLRHFDVVLVDHQPTDALGPDILRAARVTNPDTLVIVMTVSPSAPWSLEARSAGAWEVLPKPFAAEQLLMLVGRASRAVLTHREARTMGHAGAEEPPEDSMPMLGSAPAFRRAVELARRVAPTDASVVLSGESGTGKEGIARLIHRTSRRASRNLVPINCAAMPQTLLESELFGHCKGAFTGADRDKRGLLEVASGGTLFLDELTEMSQPLQAKLLRVLQDGVVRRVGSERIDATVDLRVIAATDVDPYQSVACGVLREDLFYRLRVVQIELPPLRERTEDIPLLAGHFLTLYWRRHRASEGIQPRLSTAALELLCAQPWPGNVRELQNVIENVAVLAEPGHLIRPDDVQLRGAVSDEEAMRRTLPSGLLDDAYHTARERVIAQFEREFLARLFTGGGGNMSHAARSAGINRTTLYRLIDRHGLVRDEPSGNLERA